jgi:hypothetical protein
VVMLSTMISGEFLTSNLSAAVFAFLIALLARVESFHLEQGAIRSIAVKGPRPAALPG